MRFTNLSTIFKLDPREVARKDVKKGAVRLARIFGRNDSILLWIGQFFAALKEQRGLKALERFIDRHLTARRIRGFSVTSVDRYLELGRSTMQLADVAETSLGLRGLCAAARFTDERRERVLAYGQRDVRKLGAEGLERLCAQSREAPTYDEGLRVLLAGLYATQPAEAKTEEQRIHGALTGTTNLAGRYQALNTGNVVLGPEELRAATTNMARLNEIFDALVARSLAKHQLERTIIEKNQRNIDRDGPPPDDDDDGGNQGGGEPKKTRNNGQKINTTREGNPPPDNGQKLNTTREGTPPPDDGQKINTTSGDPPGSKLDDKPRPDSLPNSLSDPLPNSLSDPLPNPLPEVLPPPPPNPPHDPLPVASRPPTLPGQLALAVPRPRGIDRPTVMDLALAMLVTACDRYLTHANHLLQHYKAINADVAFIDERLAYLWYETPKLRPVLSELVDRLQPVYERTAAPLITELIERLNREHPGWDYEHPYRGTPKGLSPYWHLRPYLPMPASTDPVEGPFAWVTLDSADPVPLEREPSQVEPDLFLLIGAPQNITDLVDECLNVDPAEDAAASPLLVAEAHMLLREVRAVATQIDLTLKPLAEAGAVAYAATQVQRDALRAQADASRVLFGTDDPQSEHVILGYDQCGRQVGMSAEHRMLGLFVGPPESGKSHNARVIAEGLILHPRGVSTVKKGQFVLFPSVDTEGRGRRGMLSGFWPNPYSDQLDYLFRYYDVDRTANFAYTHGVLYVLPEHVEATRKALPHLSERGLQILPLQVHPTEVSASIFRMLLSSCASLGSGRKPQWLARVEGLISELEGKATPKKLASALKDIKSLDARVLDSLLSQLRGLDDLIVEDRRFTDPLQTGPARPLFALTESTRRPVDVLVLFQAAIISAYNQPFADNPQRYLIYDESMRLLQHLAFVMYLISLFAERRHGRLCFIAITQLLSELHPAFVKLFNLVSLGAVESPHELHCAQALLPYFKHLKLEDLRALCKSQSYVGGSRATLKQFQQQAQLINWRPTLINAGDETKRYK